MLFLSYVTYCRKKVLSSPLKVIQCRQQLMYGRSWCLFLFVCVPEWIKMTQLRVSIYQLYYLWPPLAELRMSHLNHDITIMLTLRQTGLVLSLHAIHKFHPGIRGTAQSHAVYVTPYMSMYHKTRTVLVANCWNRSQWIPYF